MTESQMEVEKILFGSKNKYGIYAFTPKDLARFADLIAREERHACATICDRRAEADKFEGSYANACAEEIRARDLAFPSTQSE